MKKKRQTVLEVESGGHHVFLLNYHLIICTKYRKEVIDDEISNRIKEIAIQIGEKYGVKIEEFNHDLNHIHVLLRATPKTDLHKYISHFKGTSARYIRKEYPRVKEKLWGNHFWSRSFCLLTTGGAPLETLKKYIINQGKK